MMQIQPHKKNLNYFDLIFEYYKMLRELGQSIDILSSTHQDFSNYREILEGNVSIVERSLTGEPAILHGGNFYYITGWPDSIALKRIILLVLKNAKIEFFELPIGVRVRAAQKKRFWFNYSSKIQKT